MSDRPDKYSDKVVRILYNRPDLAQQNNIPEVLLAVQIEWRELSRKVGDHGSCVLGAGMQFFFEGRWYFMHPASPWQGSLSWEKHVDHIKEVLEELGAEQIYFHYGRMD